MGKIFYVMGKSASGKDTIYRRLLGIFPEFKTVMMYTTRPMREGERDGVEYYFTTRDELERLRREGRVIEERTYETAEGPWTYYTADDGQMDLSQGSCLMIGTLVSYEKMREYFGYDQLVPIYIEVEDGLRMQRALDRERAQKRPKYKELCRRFLADEEDFTDAKLEACQIGKRYQNTELEQCLEEICKDIRISQLRCSARL